MSKIVVAIGGNALGDSPHQQMKIVKTTAKNIINFVKNDNKLIIVHGNGPQVGMIKNSFDFASKNDPKNPLIEFPECGAMSQGYIGYHLQQAIGNELKNQSMDKKVVTVVTQVLVDNNDAAFDNPTKPIGTFMSEDVAKELAKKNNWVVKEDSGRGWRQVVASPKPIDVIEKEIVNYLVESNFIPITAGGGGIPVIKKDDNLVGVAAVIDKDFAAAKVAQLVDADILVILTAVDKVYINYNKDNQQAIDVLTVAQAEQYIAENQFSAGSMLPKIEAALSFIKNTGGKPAYIGSLEKVNLVMQGKSGTKIVSS